MGIFELRRISSPPERVTQAQRPPTYTPQEQRIKKTHFRVPIHLP